jgi:hypothetical protein
MARAGDSRVSIQPSRFYPFCRVKALCGKEAFRADLIFWLLFYQEKSNSPAAAIERHH